MTDWETRYYEAEASHTEANGMLTAENERLRRALSEVTNKVREIHQVMKRGEATKDHGLDGNLACILDHACSKNDPEPL